MTDDKTEAQGPADDQPQTLLTRLWQSAFAAPVRWTAFSLLPTALILLLAIVMLEGSGLLRLPFSPFTTQGQVYVESPEIYTRERLVNDRYDQDAWLRRQLENLDKAENLLTSYQSTSTSAAVGVGGGEAAPAASQSAQSASRAEEVTVPPFDQEFRLRSAMRDMIRQAILENMLDDRHDLTGNSVYGLKFDTTVLPGSNTCQRAFVRVTFAVEEQDKIKPPPPGMSAITADLGENTGEYFIHDYFKYDVVDLVTNTKNPFFRYIKDYERWLDNLAFRLNAYVVRISEVDCKQNPKLDIGEVGQIAVHDIGGVGGIRPSADTGMPVSLTALSVARDAVATVLGVDPRQIGVSKEEGIAGQVPLVLAEPWARFFQVYYSQSDHCAAQPLIRIEAVNDGFVVVDEQDFYNMSAELSDEFYPIEWYEKIHVDETNIQPAADMDSQEIPRWVVIVPVEEDSNSSVALRYKPNPVLFAWALRYSQRTYAPYCLGQCNSDPKGHWVPWPSGLFNFIEGRADFDAYAYAIFPRQDVIGTLADRASRVALRAATEGRVSGEIQTSRAVRESRTSSSMVGFGDGGLGENGEIQFGWVVSGAERGEPLQHSQLVLVSVPAWITTLKLTVQTGWLDPDSSAENMTKEQDVLVKLPPDYEAFDTLAIRTEGARQPVILDKMMQESIVVRACEPANILIPGARLWRSTAVTLGAQQADRITVLPNMRGIIAHFREVMPPPVEAEKVNGEWYAPADIMVWTSEGVDRSDIPARVVLSQQGRCPKD